MKKLLILITFLSSLIYAQNCHIMTEEEMNSIKEDYTITINIQNGVMCDNSYYWSGTIVILNACEYVNFELKTKDIIVKDTYTYLEYDEFNMPIKEVKEENTKITCVNIYKKFKKEMR